MDDSKENSLLPSGDEKSEKSSDNDSQPYTGWVSKFRHRYLVTLMICLGFICSYAMRCSIGAAVVRLTKANRTVLINGNLTVKEHPEVDWSPEIVGLVESCYYWGYCLTQLPGGVLAIGFPANRIFGFAIVLSASLNLVFPVTVHIHYALALFVRIVQGFIEGVTYPACHGIIRHWAPPSERSRMTTIAYAGTYIGIVIGMPFSSAFTDAFGWATPFYLFSIMSILWFLAWLLTVAEKPAKDTRISSEELSYIRSSLSHEHSYEAFESHSHAIPWWSILTCPAVLAIVMANVARNWLLYLLVLEQPLYFSEMFDMPRIENDLLMVTPFVGMVITVPLGGFLADMLIGKGVPVTVARKVFTCGGLYISAGCLLFVAFNDKSVTSSLIWLSLAMAFLGFTITGFNVNHLDLAPHYASVLMGISSGVSALAPALVPVLVELLLTQHWDEINIGWMWVFIMTSCVIAVCSTFYLFLASGEKAPWANPPPLSETLNGIPAETEEVKMENYGTLEKSDDAIDDKKK